MTYDVGNPASYCSECVKLKAEVETLKHPRMFPIMDGEPIPWVVIEPCERQAKINHGQSLQRLAQRGGLGCDEALCILTGQSFRMSCDPDAERKLREIVKERWYLPRLQAAEAEAAALRAALEACERRLRLHYCGACEGRREIARCVKGWETEKDVANLKIAGPPFGPPPSTWGKNFYWEKCTSCEGYFTDLERVQAALATDAGKRVMAVVKAVQEETAAGVEVDRLERSHAEAVTTKETTETLIALGEEFRDAISLRDAAKMKRRAALKAFDGGG